MKINFISQEEFIEANGSIGEAYMVRRFYNGIAVKARYVGKEVHALLIDNGVQNKFQENQK